MPFNGSGTFSIINTFVPNSTILSSAVNSNNTDIAAGLSDCMTRDGQAGATADLSMGSHKLTNVTDPTSAQDAATKNYVDTQNVAVWSTGDAKLTYKQTADTGWILFVDGTMGDASSGANTASATTAALFTLLYNSPFTDSSCPIFTSTGAATTRGAQGTAAAAYAAHCRLATPTVLGRALAIAGSGVGLTPRVLGTKLGAETVTLVQSQLPTVNLNTTGTVTVTASGVPALSVINGSAGTSFTGGGANSTYQTNTFATTNAAFTSGVTPLGGLNAPTDIMDPTAYLNVMVKL